jgi:hypothetical protein
MTRNKRLCDTRLLRATKRRCGLKINPNTTAHGKAAAAAMLQELGAHANDPDQTSRVIARLTGRMHVTEEAWRSAGLARVATYLRAYRHATSQAQDGFDESLAKYLLLATDGFVLDAEELRRDITDDELRAHASAWLHAVART